ncbi:MAG: hypothetical protein N3A65_08715, partial [candidate division WOR-3 bacterium]|nr:hypothetical protein [candidate division WOR-3 bacterium]
MKKFLFVIIITGFGLAQDIHICVDSSANGYTLLLQIHESISFSPMTDTILIVNRGFTNSNNLNITRTTGALSSFMTSSNVYQGQLGPARYPSAIAGTQLYITFPFLISGAWGGMGAQKISGSPVDVGNGDLNIHRVTGKQLPNSNLVFIGVTTDNQILAYTWDANLSQLISNNIIGINSVYVGCDCNGGVFYIFYRSLSDLLVYYRFTVDGINWTSPQQWSIPGFSSSIGYMQMALTDNGAPRIVFDAYSESDSTYRIYVSYASGVPPVMLVSVRDTTCFYPTIATGGNYCAVLYCRSRNMGSGPANRWDFYIVWSSDNGITWGQPLNCTQSLTYNPGLPQLAKRIDTVGMRVYYIYLAHINNNDDPYWTLLYGTPVPFRIYLGAKVYTGIKEKKIAQSALLSS